MSDFDYDLESVEEQIDQEADIHEHDSDVTDWSDSMDDLESDEWSRQFGESYVEDYYDAGELDDDELSRLEQRFFGNGQEEPIADEDLGDLEPLDEGDAGM